MWFNVAERSDFFRGPFSSNPSTDIPLNRLVACFPDVFFLINLLADCDVGPLLHSSHKLTDKSVFFFVLSLIVSCAF